MRRFAAIAGATAALLTLTAGPALAQTYGDPGSTTSTTTSTTTTTIPAGERVADVGPDVANPGDPVTFSSPPVFDPGSTVDVVFVRGQQGAAGIEVDEVVVNADGSVDATFTVPVDTPPGVYFVYAQGVDDDGNPMRATAVLVVLAEGQDPTDPAPASAVNASGAAASGDASGDTEQASGTSAIAPPPDVQRLQLTPEAEQSLLEEVAAAGTGAHVVIAGEKLSVSRGQESSTASPMTAGLAAGFLVLVGAIALRARRRTSQK